MEKNNFKLLLVIPNELNEAISAVSSRLDKSKTAFIKESIKKSIETYIETGVVGNIISSKTPQYFGILLTRILNKCLASELFMLFVQLLIGIIFLYTMSVIAR
jgi:hypothetical protein